MKSYETEPREEEIVAASPTEQETTQVEHVDASTSQETEIAAYKDTEAVEPHHRFRFSPPSREQLLLWAPFWGVILLGAILRFWGLGDKPLHHDESLHAYFSLQLLHTVENWTACFNQTPGYSCYQYDPLLHGPFQFHFIALTYKVSQILGAPDNGVNTTTVRILAATLGTAIVGLPYFLRDYLGRIGALLACFLLAVSPSMVYFSRFAREDIYMAFFTMLLVVAMVLYVHTHRMRWLIIGAAAFAFSYATKEATFLTIAVFGSFAVGLIAWELGLRLPLRSRFEGTRFASYLPRTAAPLTLLAYVIVAGIAAKILFAWMKATSIYITNNTAISDQFISRLKNNTVTIVPWIGILLGVYVLSILGREMFSKPQLPGRHGLAKRIDPQKQRVLDAILTMPWTHWFFALLCAWTIFLLLFTVLFTNIKGGIGDGIWQGLYYWLQQQQVARGGQPWYYYLLLIPLYEQIGVIFGLVGLVRCLVRPTRFRLFLVYWTVGNLFLYSWASEKMPWLMIHITMPMMLLAAIGLEPAVVKVVNMVKAFWNRQVSLRDARSTSGNNGGSLILSRPRIGFAGGTAIFGVVMAFLVLLPTMHNMYEVSYVHAADGPHEMMVYVQTTTDVNIVMAKIDALDQKVDGGKHQLPIVVLNDATWPFAWYLRDYPYTCFDSNGVCFNSIKNPPVIIGGGDNPYGTEAQYGGTSAKPGSYAYHLYHMRSWWDEGYKPPPCISTKTNNCADQPSYGGVGPWLWLSYGDNPPPNAKFNLGLAAQHIWQWWWQRRAFGDTGGAYDMVLFIRNDLSRTVAP